MSKTKTKTKITECEICGVTDPRILDSDDGSGLGVACVFCSAVYKVTTTTEKKWRWLTENGRDPLTVEGAVALAQSLYWALKEPPE